MRIPGFDPMYVDFKDVGRTVKLGKAEAGLVIHEGQLTAREDGFRVIEDLGASWKERTGLPLPLGMNALRRDLPAPLRRTLARVMAETVAYGLDAPGAGARLRHGLRPRPRPRARPTSSWACT